MAEVAGLALATVTHSISLLKNVQETLDAFSADSDHQTKIDIKRIRQLLSEVDKLTGRTFSPVLESYSRTVGVSTAADPLYDGTSVQLEQLLRVYQGLRIQLDSINDKVSVHSESRKRNRFHTLKAR